MEARMKNMNVLGIYCNRVKQKKMGYAGHWQAIPFAQPNLELFE